MFSAVPIVHGKLSLHYKACYWYSAVQLCKAFGIVNFLLSAETVLSTRKKVWYAAARLLGLWPVKVYSVDTRVGQE